MPRKSGVPICRHIEIGQQLLNIHNQLVRIHTELQHNYPNKAKAVTGSWRALKDLDSLRCDLDSVSANENPAEEAWSPTIYYGNNRDAWERDVPPILARHQAEQPDCACNTDR